MPTYEYRCANGHQFERFYKSMSAAQAELPCPECDAVATRQLSGGAGLLFKGSGFYLTDYGKNAHRGGASGRGKTETGKADSGTSGTAKAESSKPATEAPKKAAESKPASKPKAE